MNLKKKNTNPVIGITMGCPAGIGPEIILKAYLQAGSLFNNIVIFGDGGVLKYYAKKYRFSISFHYIENIKDIKIVKNALNIIDFKNFIIKKNIFGEPSEYAGKASLDYIAAAVDAAIKKDIDAIVTCPINKDAIHRAGSNFPGHTELLGYLTGCNKFGMMLAGKYLRVILVTTHTGLKNISGLISSSKIYNTIKIANEGLKKDFGFKNPRIAVLALNPHAGENGLFGDEEKKFIMPAIKKAKAENINAAGPFSADTLFPKVENNFDCVVCMYHDQGLIPLKLLAFGSGVNITLGLPIIRTSVDHGTAYDITGQNKADCGSFIEAVKYSEAIYFYRNRLKK